MTAKDMPGLSVAGGRKEEIRERLRPDHIWSIDCREELVPEQRVNYLYPLQRLDRAQTLESKVRV